MSDESWRDLSISDSGVVELLLFVLSVDGSIVAFQSPATIILWLLALLSVMCSIMNWFMIASSAS